MAAAPVVTPWKPVKMHATLLSSPPSRRGLRLSHKSTLCAFAEVDLVSALGGFRTDERGSALVSSEKKWMKGFASALYRKHFGNFYWN